MFSVPPLQLLPPHLFIWAHNWTVPSPRGGDAFVRAPEVLICYIISSLTLLVCILGILSIDLFFSVSVFMVKHVRAEGSL